MLPGMELMDCPGLAVSRDVMHHVVRVESSFNPFAIGVVGGRLRRQPRNLGEAVATARSLAAKGRDFSLGLAQVNRRNLARQGLGTYERAFDACANLQAGARILAECHGRARGDWGKAFSCYYSGDFRTGFRHGYVQRVFASMRGARPGASGVGEGVTHASSTAPPTTARMRIARRIAMAASPEPAAGDEGMPATAPVSSSPPAASIAATPPARNREPPATQPFASPTPSGSTAPPPTGTAAGDPAFVF